MKPTTLENMYIYDMRRQRAQTLVHLTMQKLQEFISPDDREYAANSLYELFSDKGFDVVTDEMREKAGLEPRGEMGWTERELRVLENVRIMTLLKPVSSMILPLQIKESADEPGRNL